MDTAEMYPVPTEAETQGRTDQYIGSWMKGRKRDDIVLASKVGVYVCVCVCVCVRACVCLHAVVCLPVACVNKGRNCYVRYVIQFTT